MTEINMNRIRNAHDRDNPAIKGTRAEGLCHWCGGPTYGGTQGNLFYCSEPCRSSAWNYHHPSEDEDEWKRRMDENY